MRDYVGNNTTYHARKRDFRNVILQVICWILVAAVLPGFVYWMIGA
jgi:hypothetical protein